MIGLHKPRDVVEKTIGLYDFVSFDLEKELGLVMANNCNVLENISATPVFIGNGNSENYTGEFYPELKQVAQKSLSKIISKPYFGLAKSNYLKFIAGKDFVATKKYLYVIRALMSGIYALRKEKIEADINVLNRDSMFGYSLVEELVEKKKHFKEKEEQKMNFDAESLIKKLYLDLEQAEKDSNLPDKPENFEEANQFLIETRMKFI